MNGLYLRLTALLCSVGLAMADAPVPVTTKPASYPAWWFSRGVVPLRNASPQSPLWPDDYSVADDFAAVNQGQLKKIATAAFDELESHSPLGAGAEVTALIKSWYVLEPNNGQPASPDDPQSIFHLSNGARVPVTGSQVDNFAPVNLGQLKRVAKPFYTQLKKLQYVTSYPWDNGLPDDFAIANIGQVKKLFSFDLRSVDSAHDTDHNGLADWWEKYYFGKIGVNPTLHLASGSILQIIDAWRQDIPPTDNPQGNNQGSGPPPPPATGPNDPPQSTDGTRIAPFQVSFSGWEQGVYSNPEWNEDMQAYGHYEDRQVILKDAKGYIQKHHWEMTSDPTQAPKDVTDGGEQEVDPADAISDPTPPYFVKTTKIQGAIENDDIVEELKMVVETSLSDTGEITDSTETPLDFNSFLYYSANPPPTTYELNEGDTTWNTARIEQAVFATDHVFVQDYPGWKTTTLDPKDHVLPWLGERAGDATGYYDVDDDGNISGWYVHGSLAVQWDSTGWAAELSDDQKNAWLNRFVVIITKTRTGTHEDEEPESTYEAKNLKDFLQSSYYDDAGLQDGYYTETSVEIAAVPIVIQRKGAAKPNTDRVLLVSGETAHVTLADGSCSLPDDKITWSWQQLQRSGSYNGWSQFPGNPQGAQFDSNMSQGGVYHLKAVLCGTTEVQYLRRFDEKEYASGYPNGEKMWGPGKAGRVNAFGVTDTKVQTDAVASAASYLGSDNTYPFNGVVPAAFGFSEIGTGQYKCNIFVAHRETQVGATVPVQNRGRLLISSYPPSANQWSDGTAIAHWAYLPSANPQPGWVVAHNAQGHGHCGIVDYDGNAIAAGASGTVNKLYPFWWPQPENAGDQNNYSQSPFRKYSP